MNMQLQKEVIFMQKQPSSEKVCAPKKKDVKSKVARNGWGNS